jgi:selenide,water dikinase
VGPETCDDAGVYRIGDDCALVETCDIITPVVDDPYSFGRIAAANAVSDVYAMGGRPVTAMNLVFFPACSVPPELLAEILRGGQSVLRECGVCLVGGHTVEDDELKYGLSVTGLIAPDRIVRNSTSRPGDLLILTKPLGTGIISTAIKGEMASGEAVQEAIRWMTTINRLAAELMCRCNAGAATDVTGFGLVGHVSEMARGAGVTMELHLSSIPLISSVRELVADGMVPAGCYRNRDHYLPFVLPASFPDEADLLPLFDPQTSGGMLIALSRDDAGRFLEEAERVGLFARQIGRVLPFRTHSLEIV